MKAYYILLFTVLLSFSCNSVKRTERFVSQGNYDEAINLAVKKLKKDKTAKEFDKHIKHLEVAFLKATDRDLREIEFLKKDKSTSSAKKVYYTYLDLKDRQNKIRPLLPLHSREMGRKANFIFSDYSNEILNSKENYLKALYQEAQLYLNSNLKRDFRSAFNVLCEIDEVQPNYRDVKKLKEDAHFYGTDFVLVELNNHTGQFIPFRLEQDLLDFNTYDLNEFWKEYHGKPEQGINYDLGIDLNFQSIQISPERISEKRFTRKERVKDGYNYRYDRGGNIIKDSLGNPIKVDKFKDVSALVTITTQQKSVFVGGEVVYKDLNNKRRLKNFPLSAEFIFENVFLKYRGDKRALSNEDMQLLTNHFIIFPSNEQMVLDAGTVIKENFREILINNPF